MTRLVFTASFLFVASLSDASAIAQTARGFDTNYVLGDSFIFGAVSPSRALAHLPEDSPIRKSGFPPIKESGLGLADIDSYAVQAAAADGPMNVYEQILIVMQASQPIDLDRFAGSMGPRGERFDYQGRPRYKGGFDGMPDIYFPSDRTMLMAMPDRIETAAKSPMSMSPIVSRLRGISPTAEAVVLVDFSLGSKDVFRELLEEGFFPLGEELVDLLDEIKTVTAVADLANDKPISVVVLTESETAANQVQALVQKWLPMAKTLIEQSKERDIPREDARASFARMMDALALAFDNAKVVTEGNEVRFVVEQNGGLKGLAEVMNLLMIDVVEAEAEALEGIEIK